MGDFGRLSVPAYRAHGDHTDLSDHYCARGESLRNAIPRSSLTIDDWAWRRNGMLLHQFEVHRLWLSLWCCIYGNLSRSCTLCTALVMSCAGVHTEVC